MSDVGDLFESAKTVEDLVFTALGAASACWENLEGAGVFMSERAKAIGEELLRLLNTPSPWLGFATTKQLIDELAARARVSEVIGEPWPGYRTVGTQ